MSVKKMSIGLVGLLLGLAGAQAHADAPNYYQCKGDNIAITFYDHSGLNNTTLLNVKLGNSKYSADGTNIESKATVIGTVKSLTVKILPDVEVKKASFIIPTINLGQNFNSEFVRDVSFKSQLAITTIATPFISTPYIGVVNSSQYFDLNCKASLVVVPL
ncbi:MAG: hypothetical protein PHU14_10105 [Methylovulum sp.]|nr:hypothetical protein [Methylovulum sp.]